MKTAVVAKFLIDLRLFTYVFNVRLRTVNGRCGPEDWVLIVPQALATETGQEDIYF